MKRTLGAVLSLLLSSCLTSPDPEASYPLSAPDDQAYYPVYQQSSKHFDVINNFETKFSVDITHLTPGFRQAMAKRYEHIFKDAKPFLAEAGGKTGFFVSLYVPSRELQDLEMKELWNISLEANGQKLAPATVQRLNPKERWAPFFPSVSLWSQEYLLLFDVPPPAGDAPQGFVLTLSSPNGSVRSEW